jgi:hypothetical protein
MEISSHEQNGVIVRRFSGDILLEDVIVSWNTLFATYPDLKDYKGIATVFLDANFKYEAKHLDILLEYFNGYLDHLKGLKIAFVMDSPLVTSIIILGQRLKTLRVSPFTTEKAAMEWILL